MQQSLDKTYQYWRKRTLYSLYIGYAFFYFTRKGFVFALPAIMTNLHLTKLDVGLLGSIFYITYGLSKFANGLWADRTNPKYVMAIGLIATGIISILFGTSSSLIFMSLLWFLNGFFQSFGWPACAKSLTHWYSQNERGVWWGIWNTSHTVGSTLIPLATGFIVTYFNWRFGMYVFGVMTIIIGFFVLNRLGDIPEMMNLPPIEEYRNDYPTNQNPTRKTSVYSIKEIVFKYIIRNKYIWILACPYIILYFIRCAITDWGAIYLTSKGYSLLSSDSFMALIEIGGFGGSIAAGWLSDRIFNGRRIPVNIIFCLGIAACVMVFHYLTASNLIAYSINAILLGFFIFGPQMLIGMAAAELSHREAAGTATGFLAIFAYFGASLSGFPVGLIIQKFGWPILFGIIIIASLISAILLIPIWRIRTTWE